MADFTVAICTYRREAMLAITLASLASCDKPDAAWDVVVIDNASEAPVKSLVESFRERLPIRYVAEPRTGTSFARNRAIEESSSPIVLFTDDDVEFDRGWLTGMVAAVRSHAECEFWGGRIRPTWAAGKPGWFDVSRSPMLGDVIVRYEAGEASRPWRPEDDPPFYTANLALRVEAVRAAGMFDTTLGHKGGKRLGGEDSWLVRSISRRGGKGWYAADAIVDHPVPAERLTKTYARRFAWRQGWIGVEMLRREGGRVPRWLYRAAAQRGAGAAWRWLKGVLGGDPIGAFEGQVQAIFNVSKLWHAVRG